LDGSDLYAGSLDINQINVTTSLSWVAASNLYSFTINAKNGSNVYTSDSLEVTLTVGRTLINTITDLDTTLDFLTTPADAEVYAQFMYSNNSKITGSNLPATDFTWGSIGLTGVTFTVNGNEYYYTNANVSLT
jgi:hypothetical protein